MTDSTNFVFQCVTGYYFKCSKSASILYINNLQINFQSLDYIRTKMFDFRVIFDIASFCYTYRNRPFNRSSIKKTFFHLAICLCLLYAHVGGKCSHLPAFEFLLHYRKERYNESVAKGTLRWTPWQEKIPSDCKASSTTASLLSFTAFFYVNSFSFASLAGSFSTLMPCKIFPLAL